MNPDSMRKIDFWAGVPLCFFITRWYKLQRFLGLKDPQYARLPQNVLFIELAEMGSTVLAYPAFRLLKELYPRASIHFLTFKQNAATADIIDLIPHENVLTIDSSSIWKFISGTASAALAARRRRIDTVVNLEMFARYSTILSYLSGAPKRVGLHRFYQEGLYTGDFLTHKLGYNPHIHTAEMFLALVRALAEPKTDIPLGKFSIAAAGNKNTLELPKVKTEEAEKKRMWEKLKQVNSDISEKSRLVLLNPNASKLIEVRKWPMLNYAALARKIIAEHGDVYIVITGSQSEYGEGEFLKGMAQSTRVLNLAGKTTLRELIDLFNISEVLITNDSGPAHFASLTNIHIMVFFGPETPLLYKPLSDNCTVLYANYACSPCVSAYNQRRTPCNANKCLEAIEQERVYEKVREVLAVARMKSN